MAITLEQSRTDLRAMIGEVSPIRFADADLNDWLDQGQRDVAALTLGYQKRAEFADTDNPQAMIAGVREFAVSGPVASGGLGISDSIAVLHVWLNGDSIQMWNPIMLDTGDPRSAGGGTPHYWYEFAGNIGFIPYPNAAFIAGTFTFEMLYAAYPTEWTSGASVLPSGLDELPTYFALSRALIRLKRWSSAWQTYQFYFQMLLDYRQIILSRITTPKSDLRRPTKAERTEFPRRVVSMGR